MKVFLVIALTVFIMLSGTSTFAQAIINKQESNFTFEKKYEYSYQRPKRQIQPLILVPTKKIENVVGPWAERTKNQLRSSNFNHPGGTMSVSEGRAASFGGSISADILSAALDFKVNKSYEISDSQTIQVPAGKRAKVIAYQIDNVWRYEIYKVELTGEENKDGTYWARKPVGVWFDVKIY